MATVLTGSTFASVTQRAALRRVLIAIDLMLEGSGSASEASETKAGPHIAVASQGALD